MLGVGGTAVKKTKPSQLTLTECLFCALYYVIEDTIIILIVQTSKHIHRKVS